VTADHPPLDTLADHVAGLQSSDAASEVAAHLAQCPACVARAESVREVPSLLADVGAVSPSMPESVWRNLEQALRGEADNRAPATESLSDRRATKRPAGSRRTTWSLLAAAAAVVVVTSGVELSQHLGGGVSNDNSDAAASPSRAESTRSAAGGFASSGATSHSLHPDNQGSLAKRLTPQNVSQYANQLAATQPRSKGGPSIYNPTKFPAGCAPPVTSAADIVAVRRWKGAPAVIVVDPKVHRVRVFDCGTPSVLLYSTSY
jgi:anti-sigma factor RsiW